MIREWSKSGALCGLLRCELFSGLDSKGVSLARKRVVRQKYWMSLGDPLLVSR